ncbi:unnamed protein product [Didymodactylos carnosus]|uniref:WWE domain-containing protein n=1 Tax=Didymodactylos carnosus TaxID=1234261 RepID=A0A814AEQ5_9BILA|nr:unnamed protein product [Didymodactylos carnosus]CAF0912562.1 unnamed protein product [Didymodactylos carnosus]CAF3648733.1 unnamed protein product [Didymodactylos carnosus]CAF3693352.1 unnamed protein product [Didymodactylos carnosus]
MGNRSDKNVIPVSTDLPIVHPVFLERPIWYWNSDKNPWSSSPELCKWQPYSDIENEIIETAYQSYEKQVLLDNYIIDLEHKVQIDKQDEKKTCPIKQFLVSSQNDLLRTERFYFPQKLVQSFSEVNSNRFLNEWKNKNHGISLSDKLEQAADGIIKEGKQLGLQTEPKWIAKELREMKDKPNEEIEKYLISLYTKECFIYKIINKTLRENDRSKLDTLGALCQLLYHCDCSSTFKPYGYNGLLYRGAQLDQQTIDGYIQAVGSKKTWDAFSSTSKKREKAEKFGNVLFIIELKSSSYHFSGMDISSYSYYPEEEEVLVRAARNFIIEKVERDDMTGKYCIYLSLC